MRQNRTCKLCGFKAPSSLLTHKGSSIFHCKDKQACSDRTKDAWVNQTQTTPKPKVQPELNHKTNKYVVTSVVEGISLVPGVLDSLEHYCKETGAELVVMSISYKVSSDEEGDTTPLLNPRVEPYLLTSELVLNGKVRLLGDLQINATAVNPLSGLYPVTRGLTSLAPHTQLALESIATAASERAIMFYTTGCITQPIYSDSKAGYKAKFHHSISAIVVEFDDNLDYFIRTLPIDKDNNIFDLGIKYHPKKAINYKVPTTLVCGDSHVGSLDTANHQALTGLASDLELVNVVIHDVFDGSSINHHELGNPFSNNEAYSSLVVELKAVGFYLKTWAELVEGSVVVVDSNHHDFIVKWLDKVDWKDLKGNDNQLPYLELASAKLKGHKNLLKYALELYGDTQDDGAITWLTSDKPYFIDDNDVSNHGHLGSNGARGSVISFNNLGYKTVTGHTHSARINKGSYVNGTSSLLNLSYMKGLSSHSHTHTLIFEGGKRQMFTTYNGKWQA